MRIQDAEKEKRSLFEKVLSSEQVIGDRERDIELRDIKIESLENVIKKRAEAQLPPQSSQTKKKDQIKLTQLEEEITSKDAFIKKLERKVAMVEQQMTDKLAEQLKKQVEIQKLLEQNIATLEGRCELLEMQNEQVKSDRDDAQRKILQLKMQGPPQQAYMQLTSVTSPTFQGIDNQQRRSGNESRNSNHRDQQLYFNTEQQENDVQMANHSF